MNREMLFAIGAVIMWGTMATAAKLLTGSADSMTVLFWTCLSASAVLAVFSACTGKLKELKKMSSVQILRMAAIGSLGVFFYNWFFYLGTERLPAQTAMVINDLWPALIIVFSCIILKEKMNAGKLLAVFLSFLGIIIVVANGDLSAFQSISITGALFCLADAVCYALYSVLNKRESYDKGLSVLVAYAAGTLSALIILLVQGRFRMLRVSELPGYLFNGTVCNAFPYLLWAYAMEKGNTAVIANLAYLAPFVSLLMTHFVLGEEITVWSVLGLVLIVSGIFLQLSGANNTGAVSAGGGEPE